MPKFTGKLRAKLEFMKLESGTIWLRLGWGMRFQTFPFIPLPIILLLLPALIHELVELYLLVSVCCLRCVFICV